MTNIIKPVIEGGSPVRGTFLPFSRPSIGPEEVAAVSAVMNSGWLTMGPRVQEFEEKFADYVGSKYAIAVSSCTAALHLSLILIKTHVNNKHGLNIFTSPLTFPATINSCLYVDGIEVDLVDIIPITLNMDKHYDKNQDIWERICEIKQTPVVLPVHYGGVPSNPSYFHRVAVNLGGYTIEDAAHAAGASENGKKVGSIGDLTCFSFHAVKNMTTGEGGMITTNNESWARELRKMRLHGMDLDAHARYGPKGRWDYDISCLGHKYNMTDISAAIGLVQLAKLDEMNESRALIADSLVSVLKFIQGVTVQDPIVVGRVWHLFPILLNLEHLTINRDKFMEALLAENIGCSLHFKPICNYPFYQKELEVRPEDYPNAQYVYDRIITLPIYPSMTAQDMDDVVNAVEKLCNYYRKEGLSEKENR